jgi:hypothetical protein
VKQSRGPTQVDQLQSYRPSCTKCGALMKLEHIEPSDDPDHDLRTFECPNCGHVVRGKTYSTRECAGVQIRETIRSSNGRIYWVTDEAESRLRVSGALVSTGEGHFIPRHLAHTPRDLVNFLAEYQRFAERFASRCLLRGQNRDYFDEGELSVEPSAFRTPRLRGLFAGRPHWSRLDEQLTLWEPILCSVGIDVDSRVKHRLRLEHGGEVSLHARHAAARIASNPELGAILQHYGFPTPHLDVTSSAAVALYFALHKSTKTRAGLCFKPVDVRRLGSVSLIEPFPSIHVYFSSAHFDLRAETVDLCSLQDLIRVARRPSAQHAYSLTCVAHDVGLAPKSFLSYSTDYHPRRPVAIIKVAFPYASASGCFEPLTQRELFPTDEPIYKALLRARAPHLVRYV